MTECKLCGLASSRHLRTCAANPSRGQRRALGVMTPDTLARVPNQPKTPQRTVRVPDDLWNAAKVKAEERGEELSAVIRAALERYVKRK